MEMRPSAPRKEATTLIIGVGILAGFGAYYASVHRVPFLWTALDGVATVLCWIPAISNYRLPSVFLSSAGAGLIVAAIGLVFSSAIEKMCGPRIAEMEQQMRQRQKSPRRVKIR
jgi:hypothetical protein